jgi:hypothetical protein
VRGVRLVCAKRGSQAQNRCFSGGVRWVKKVPFGKSCEMIDIRFYSMSVNIEKLWCAIINKGLSCQTDRPTDRHRLT